MAPNLEATGLSSPWTLMGPPTARGSQPHLLFQIPLILYIVVIEFELIFECTEFRVVSCH